MSKKVVSEPWIIDSDPRQFWTIYGQQDNPIAKVAIGDGGSGLANENLIVYACNYAPDIARKLIESLDVIKEMCDEADKYVGYADAHPERNYAASRADGADRTVAVGRLFLASIKKGDADNGP